MTLCVTPDASAWLTRYEILRLGLGDCIAINGQVSRYIEPIGRQAKTVAASIVGGQPAPYVSKRVPLRIKTSSLPLTV